MYLYDSQEENKVVLMEKEIEGKKFYYKNFGREVHGKISFRLWINRKLVKFDENKTPFIEFPIKGAKIIKTDKGNLVLRNCEGWSVFKIGIVCGYRGVSFYEILQPGNCEVFEYKMFSSPIGSLGISRYALVNVPDTKLKVKYSRSGKTYGEPSNFLEILYVDGRIESISDLQDGIEALKEIEDLTQE